MGAVGGGAGGGLWGVPGWGVEYTEYFSGQTSYAMAEAPKEALPHNCRPDFGAVWSTTAKFKVNESYNCRYTLGSTKADIYSDKLFNCTAEDPSIIEMLKRIFVLFSKFCKSKDFSSWWMLGYAAAGVVAGVITVKGLFDSLEFFSESKRPQRGWL
uniref:Uncharacterized protein n=1 Tax=Aegilops tauschii TaxID=37682 RepID=N1QRB1_AEGTA